MSSKRQELIELAWTSSEEAMRGRVAAFLLIASKLSDAVAQFNLRSKRAKGGRSRLLCTWPKLFSKNYATFTSICLALASSTFGRVTKSNPSLDSAVIFFVSTNGGSVKLRKNWP